VTSEQIARVCHEANKAYCEATGGLPSLPWEEAKASAVEGVEKVLETLKTQGVVPHPQASHNSWMSKKLRDGWRYGAEKSAEQKMHPCLLPWEELPKEEQVKDILFIQIVTALAWLMGIVPPQRKG